MFFTSCFFLLQQFPDLSRSNLTEEGRQGSGLNEMGSNADADDLSDSFTRLKNILTPLQIRNKLSEHVIGQERVKKTLAVGVYNHYKRICTSGVYAQAATKLRPLEVLPNEASGGLADMNLGQFGRVLQSADKKQSTSYENPEINNISNPDFGRSIEMVQLDKSNILLLGPTGSGKTLLVKTLAKEIDVPLVITDATCLTEAGYVGEDVESVLKKVITKRHTYSPGSCRV